MHIHTWCDDGELQRRPGDPVGEVTSIDFAGEAYKRGLMKMGSWMYGEVGDRSMGVLYEDSGDGSGVLQ